ncbi:CPBP family intramembrane metalloprotease [Candidatus Poribacteria bacterium]|nr:CPBP family intramembrane metalloprotease [Candidatus Poribacteria bacterium]
MDINENNLLSREILIMLALQIPVNILFFLLYKPYVIHPYTNMVYFLVLFIISYPLANKYGNLKHIFIKEKSALITIFWATASMFIFYSILKFRALIFNVLPFFSKIEQVEPGKWEYFTKPWLEINLLLSVSGIFLVVAAMEIFYRAYIQELLNKYFNSNKSLILMAVLSGAHSAVLGPISGMVDFSLALIWGYVYKEAGLYSSIFVHMVWDILFIYFPGK